MTDVAPKITTEENVRVARYDANRIREHIPAWDGLSKPAQQRQLHRTAVEPSSVTETSNVTCVGLHEYLAEVLTLGIDEGDALDPPAQIGFGNDDSSFSPNDADLNNEVGSRIAVTSPAATGTQFSVDELLSTSEQNGNTLRELGLFGADGTLYQHAPTDQVYEKDSTFALVISITIPISDA